MQAELRLKGSPHLGPVRHRPIGGQRLPMQKAMLNRQHSRQHRAQMAPPPIQTANQPSRASLIGETMNSPLGQPTPPSQRSSPSTTRSPGFPLQGLASPTAEMAPQQQFPRQRQMQPMPQQFQQQQRAHNRSLSANTIGHPYSRRSMHVPISQTQTQYYPTSFQKHYDQLGKFSPFHPSHFLSGSCVRPRLSPLVQTRSMTLKLICLTTWTAMMWIQIASFQTSDCHLKMADTDWVCKHLHLRQLQQLAMQAANCHLSLSTMIQCLMRIHLVLALLCIFRILLVDYSSIGDSCKIGISLIHTWRLFLVMFGYVDQRQKFSDGAWDRSHTAYNDELSDSKAERAASTLHMGSTIHTGILSPSFVSIKWAASFDCLNIAESMIVSVLIISCLNA